MPLWIFAFCFTFKVIFTKNQGKRKELDCQLLSALCDFKASVFRFLYFCNDFFSQDIPQSQLKIFDTKYQLLIPTSTTQPISMKCNSISICICAFCIFFSAQVCAQNASLCRQAFSAAGESAERQSIHYDYTIGEAVVATFQTGAATLTQGFQQGEECSALVLGTDPTVDFSVLIYPNPTVDYIHFQYEGDAISDRIYIQVVDALGKSIALYEKNTVDFSEIDCRALQAGTYVLFFQDEAGKRLGTFPFVKI